MFLENIFTGINTKTNNKYIKNAERVLNSYEDEDYAYKQVRVEANKDEDITVFDKKARIVFPFLNFVTDNLSKMYSETVIRTLDENNKNNNKLQSLLKEVNDSFNLVSKTVDKYTFLTGNTAVKSFFNADLDKFKFIVFPSNMIDYTPYYNDPSEAQEISVKYLNNNTVNEETWSKEEVVFNVNNTQENKTENIYDEIPFTIFRNEEKQFDFFDSPKTNLLNAQNLLSIKLINTDRTFKYQSASILTFKSEGATDISELNVGPSSVNVIGENDSIDFVNSKVDLNNLLTYIKDEFRMISKLRGIPDSLFEISSNASGVSIVASQKVMLEYIKERQNQFTNYEKELFEKSIRILAKHRNITIPEDFEINIIYKNQIEPLNEDEIKLWDFYFDNNIYTNIDLLMQLESITKEEAETKIKTNKEYNDNNYINEKTTVKTIV